MDWDTVELLNDKEAEIEDLKEQNTRLQAQLNKEIQINRKMKSVLKDISEQFDKIDFGDFEKGFICLEVRLVLKEIDNKE